jgi:hypothetical protein
MTNQKADPHVYSKTAWDIASRYSSVLASETRDLAAAIDTALASQPAAAPVGGREEIAAFLLARDEADTNVLVPHGLILWARNLLTNGKDAAHSGDCTNECHSCIRCTADRALRDADAILAVTPGERDTGYDPRQIRELLGAFYKTVDVMKSARNSETKDMNVWADDMKAVEDVVLFLEQLRDATPPVVAGADRAAVSLSDFTDAQIATEHGWRMQRALGDPRICVGGAIVDAGKVGEKS